MKKITPALLSFLEANNLFYRADLFSIVLPNGDQINATNGQMDISWAGTTYYAAQNGAWDRGTVASVADFSLDSQSMELTVIADTDIYYPGTTTPLMSLVASGLFDGATVNALTVYMPLGQWGNIIGALTLFGGMIVDVQDLGRSKAQFEVRDWMFLMNLKVPTRIIQPGCFNTLFDAGCTLSSSAFALANTVGAGSSQIIIKPGTAWPATDHLGNSTASPYFNQGKIVFTSGQNIGLSGSVISEDGSGNLTLNAALLLPVAVGDAFNAYPGCDKTIPTCTNKFQNQPHFEGMPFVPPPETSA